MLWCGRLCSVDGPKPSRDPAVQLWAHALAALRLLESLGSAWGGAWGGTMFQNGQPPGPPVQISAIMALGGGLTVARTPAPRA